MYPTKLFFLVCILARSLSADDSGGKFSYDKKLLDKVIRMEIRMESMETEMRAYKNNVHSFIQNYTDIMENKTAELELMEGRVDLPLVAFSAYNPVDVSPDTNQIIIWQNTRLNEGNAYDTVIGIFTAPVSGLYYFAVHVCNYGGVTLQYAIVLEQELIARSYKYDNAINDCGSMSAVTMVADCQRVWVKCTSGSTSNNQIWESSGRSSFVGVLMHK